MVGASMLKGGVLVGILSSRTSALKVAYSPACAGVSMDFEEFVQVHGRSYKSGSEEYTRRHSLFESRVNHISAHNCADEHPWVAQVNHLADWTEEELMSLRGYKKAYDKSAAQMPAVGNAQLDTEDPNLPHSWSWAHLNSISTPTDQGQCGSCWAYAATCALNAHAEINNVTTRFSASQVVACTPNPQQCGGSGGCDGATAELAYEYALFSGLDSEEDFPRLAFGKQAKCPSEKKAPNSLLSTGISSKGVLMPDGGEKHMAAEGMRGRSMGMLGWTKLPENKEKPILRALVEYGPLAVAVAAGSDWNWYYQGILTPQGCDKNHVISHAVVLFGYGKANSVKRGEVKYWRIKNSWGKGWGEEGNLRLQRLDDEEKDCYWDNSPEVGSGCKGGPSKVWVCGSCGILYDTVMPMFRL